MHVLDDPHPLSVTTTENLLTCVIFMEVSGTDLVRYVVTDFQKNKHIGTNCASLANIVI